MTKLPFFDCNCMIGRYSVPRLGNFFTTDRLLEEMDFFGIEEALVYHALAKEYAPGVGNEKLLEEIKGNKRMHSCWVLLPPSTEELSRPEELIETMLSKGIRAVRLFPKIQNFSLDEWSWGEFWTLLEKHKMIVLIGLDQTSWKELNDIGARYPRIPIILTEVNYGINRNLYPLLEKFNNLFIEISGYQVHRGIETICKRFGAKHLIFGSRMPFYTPGSTLMMLTHAKISEAEKSLIANGNLRRLLKEVGN